MNTEFGFAQYAVTTASNAVEGSPIKCKGASLKVSMDTPDRWIVVTIALPGETPYDKVLMGWTGSYMGSASWQLNSGNKEVIEYEDSFVFRGFSGSVYKCLKSRYGTTIMSASVLQKLLENPNVSINSHYDPDKS